MGSSTRNKFGDNNFVLPKKTISYKNIQFLYPVNLNLEYIFLIFILPKISSFSDCIFIGNKKLPIWSSSFDFFPLISILNMYSVNEKI